MNLLFGGDSFAQFPSHWYQNRNDSKLAEYPSSTKGNGLTIDYSFKHWGEIISNGNATSVGIGGADISATSAVTVQQLLTGKYTHCVFSVTDWYRDTVSVGPRNPADMFELSSKYVSEFYCNEQIICRHMPESQDCRHRTIGNWWWSATDEIKGDNRHNIDTYLSIVADYKYIHDRLSNLALIVTVCKQKNIPLVLSLPFGNTNNIGEVLDCNLFDYTKNVPIDRSSEFFKWAISHHSEEDHNKIAEQFLTQFPEWKKQ